MIVILIASVFLVSGIIKWDQTQHPQNATWQQTQEQQLKAFQQQLGHGELSSDEENYYKTQIQMINYRLENDVAPASDGTFWSWLVGSKNLMSLITLFTIIVGAGIIANEFSRGTIKLLAIRPITRGTILYSKYVTTILYALVLMGLLFVTSVIAGFLLFPFEDATYLTIIQGNVIEHSMLLEVFKWYLYSGTDLIIMMTIAFVIATVFRSSSLAIGLSIFLLFTGKQVVMLLQSYSWAKYILFANSDFTQFLNPFPFVEGLTPLFSVGVLAVYLVIFHLLTYFVFTKRDIAV